MTELQMEVETIPSSPKEAVPKEAVPKEAVPKNQVIYRCRKCRRIVAVEENIVPHEPGKGEECFAWKKRSRNSEQVQCSSIFVEPMKWMQTSENLYQKTLCSSHSVSQQESLQFFLMILTLFDFCST